MVPVLNTLEVIDASIVVILTGENDSVQIAGMSIGDRVTYCCLESQGLIEHTVALDLLFVSYLPKPAFR